MSHTIRFELANAATHRDALLSANLEYMSWVAAGIEQTFGLTSKELLGMELPQYVASVIDKVCGEPPPRGAFYLVYVDGALAGMGGLRPLDNGACEIKRIYVRPAARGLHMGQTILRRLLADAQAFGYQRVCLDSAPFMQSAQRIYAAEGFVDCDPYAGVEVPAVLHAGWRFMQRALEQPAPLPKSV
ncbi:GNAT family N-acetyltransferase [Rhodoferax sp. AJA081-3]|uniref:GNAT family N-acetyltransferase n=1 Tax=Rhodoferax sp. AJA081-3 TaxID=2752316 RepID=UPI001ADFA8C4|nr:GNAT family N-acetyltransferase [Rhodoferax sp. AJA081-3]QTN27971.1 GNAT family N-acetyltransferase [Rhodoferax sp. AJA081-3]